MVLLLPVQGAGGRYDARHWIDGEALLRYATVGHQRVGPWGNIGGTGAALRRHGHQANTASTATTRPPHFTQLTYTYKHPTHAKAFTPDGKNPRFSFKPLAAWLYETRDALSARKRKSQPNRSSRSLI